MTDEPEAMTGLTRELQLLWGAETRPRRGPKPALSLQRIVAAAIELADEEGLSALSMSRLAERLGFTTMSLYRYVATKDDLLVLMVDAAAGQPLPPRADTDWRTGLIDYCHGMTELYRRHPWSLQIPITGPPLGPNNLAWMDSGLRPLADTGLLPKEQVGVLMLFVGYVRFEAQLATDTGRAQAEAGITERAVMDAYAQALALLVDAERYPALHALVAAGAFQEEGGTPDEDFQFGLDRLLDGVEVLINARRRTRTS